MKKNTGGKIKEKDLNQWLEDAISQIEPQGLLFVQDVIDLMPISNATFYLYFPDGSDVLDKIKKLLNKNKVGKRIEMRKKFSESDNSAVQLAFYKLIASRQERQAIATTYVVTDDEKMEQGNDVPDPVFD